MAHRIFVYGTLKRGFANHALLHNATFLGEARTRTAYPMVVHGTGFSVVIIPEPGIGHRVVGEVWEVDDAQLAQLDKLAHAFPWKKILRHDIPVSVEAACKKSKIYHSGAVAQRIDVGRIADILERKHG